MHAVTVKRGGHEFGRYLELGYTTIWGKEGWGYCNYLIITKFKKNTLKE